MLLLQELHKTKAKAGETVFMDELARALSKVKAVAMDNNEAIRDHEAKEALYKLQERFAPPEQLAGPHMPRRRIVREGVLRKVHGRGSRERPCVWVLLSDQLLYAREESSTTAGEYLVLGTLGDDAEAPPSSLAPGKYLVLHRRIALAEPATRFDDVPDSSAHQHAIAVLSADKSSLFLCASAPEKAAWLRALHETHDAALAARNRTRSHQASERAAAEAVVLPLFQSDHSVSKCMVSGVTFTMFERRHHCRACGWVVCDAASRGRADLRNITHAHSKSATSNLGKNCRVCDLCVKAHDELGSWVKAVQYRSKVTRL